MIEDPALFLPFASACYGLWIPRLVLAMIAVRLLAPLAPVRRL
jgi:hypothetical protein